jgi:hypothetical protein
VIAALRPIGITLLDHIIVAGDTAVSLADAGLIAELSLSSRLMDCLLSFEIRYLFR